MKLSTRLFLLVILSFPIVTKAQPDYARKGILPLTDRDISTGAVPLDGEWEFYMSELISPEEFHTREQNRSSSDYVDFPSQWNDTQKGRSPGEGYATYRLRVIIKSPQSLAFAFPDLYTSYSFWVNSKLITANGVVGTNAQSAVPQWRPHTVTFNAEKDTLDLVLQVSNFSHAKGGIRESILLGNSEYLKFKRRVAVASNLTLCASLTIIAVTFLFLYFFSNAEESIIYFSALCINWAVRSLFSNDYLFNSFFPDFPWEICAKIEYITLYLMMIWAILFLGSIFKNDVNVTFKYLFCVCNLIFTGLTIFFKASVFTQFLPIYLSFAGVLMIYVLYVLTRAAIHERLGIWLMMTSIFLGVIIFSYNIISYEIQATFNPIIINGGYIVMFLLLSFVLLIKMGYFKKTVRAKNMLTYEDLYGNSDSK